MRCALDAQPRGQQAQPPQSHCSRSADLEKDRGRMRELEGFDQRGDCGWLQYRLGSPEALIKVFVSRSNCFRLVDRGSGFAAAQRERALAAGGDLRSRDEMALSAAQAIISLSRGEWPAEKVVNPGVRERFRWAP